MSCSILDIDGSSCRLVFFIYYFIKLLIPVIPNVFCSTICLFLIPETHIMLLTIIPFISITISLHCLKNWNYRTKFHSPSSQPYFIR